MRTLHPALIQGDERVKAQCVRMCRYKFLVTSFLSYYWESSAAKLKQCEAAGALKSHTSVLLQSKTFSVGIGVPYPLSFLLTATKAGSGCCRMSSKAPEGDDGEEVAVVLSEIEGILTFKKIKNGTKGFSQRKRCITAKQLWQGFSQTLRHIAARYEVVTCI